MAGELIAVRLPHESPAFDPSKVSVHKKLPFNSGWHRTHVSRFMPDRKFRKRLGVRFQAVREDGQLTPLDDAGYSLEPSEKDFLFIAWLGERRKAAIKKHANYAARQLARQGRALVLRRVMSCSEYMTLIEQGQWLKLMGVHPLAHKYTLAYARDMISRGVLR